MLRRPARPRTRLSLDRFEDRLTPAGGDVKMVVSALIGSATFTGDNNPAGNDIRLREQAAKVAGELEKRAKTR